MKVKTNNQFRPLLSGVDLTNEERKEFNYLDDIDSGRFFKYRGQVYDLGEFLRTSANGELSTWDGYSSDSAFSGVVVKVSSDCEYVKVGSYYC